MFGKRNSSILALTIAFLCLPRLATAKEQSSDDFEVPVVVIEAGQTIDSNAIQNLIEGFASPVVNGEALRRELAITERAGEEVVGPLKEVFAIGQDDFFNGKYPEAKSHFEKVIALAEENPSCYFHDPKVRELVFKAHIHLSVIAKGEEDTLSLKRNFERAAQRFPELLPQKVDFPPWVREQFAAVKEAMKTPRGAIEVDAPSGCEFWLAGRNLGRGRVFKGIHAGRYIAQMRCPEKESSFFSIVVEGEKTNFRPVLTSQTDIVPTQGEFVLKADDDASEAALVDDALSVAAARNWTKLVAVVGSAPGSGEVWVVDRRLKGISKRISLAAFDEISMSNAGYELNANNPDAAALNLSETKKPWYKDVAAWSFLVVGLAATGVGIGMFNNYGRPSLYEPVYWSLIIAGGGSALTGTALFFAPVVVVPDREVAANRSLEFGAVAGLRF